MLGAQACVQSVRAKRGMAESMDGLLRRVSSPILFLVAVLLLLPSCGSALAPEPPVEATDPPLSAYRYPFDNPLVATVVTTPREYEAKLPEDVPVETRALTVFPDRRIPEIFWYADRLHYSLVARDERAPLVFVIAGTGADYDGRYMEVLQKALYTGGFHVVSLPSPTHPNFIVSASETGVPGRIRDDARDLYRLMRLTYEDVKDEVEVSEFHLTGYSLGGWQAAYVAELDDEQGIFDFGKVLMINPPVSLHASASILDNMLLENVPGGVTNLKAFFDHLLRAFSRLYRSTEFVNFSDDFLYRAYEELDPSDQELAALIGLTFRLLANSMMFTADVMSKWGYLVPADERLTIATSLTDYAKVSANFGFEQYLDGFLYPFYRAKDPGLTREHLLREASLRSIEGYLRSAKKIGLLTNADDIILAPGDLEFLRQVFGPRARIYPTGGHIGNLDSRDVVAHIVAFFQGRVRPDAQ